MAYIEPSKRTTLDWMKEEHMWRSGLTKKALYEAAKLWRFAQEIQKTQPLHVAQKRDFY